MPTADRPRWVPGALACFAAQDYPNLELVVVDQGREPVAAAPPTGARVRYSRQARDVALADLRNVGCSLASGEIIVHWDDDDWSAPWRVSHQIRGLLDSGADLCGAARAYYLDVRDRTTWEYVYPEGRRPYVLDNTLCYWRDFWERAPFPGGVRDSELRFQWNDPAARIHALDGHRFVVGTIHGANTSPKDLDRPRWHRCSQRSVRMLMGDTWDDYCRRGETLAQGTV
jgi:glycosyltransferase involved in cell wall biosynthesis